MFLSNYSNLDHLKAVALNLCLSEDVNGFCEREVAALINAFYQDQRCEVAPSCEKRKREVDTCSDSKKLRVSNKVSNILSALELVPNEVYEIILKGLGGEDKKNLRITSKILYDKTTLMAPMFQNWSFEANYGVQPDFILKTVKKYHVSVKDTEIAPVTNLLNHVNKISRLQIEMEGVLFKCLRNETAEFTQLTSLDLEFVHFDDTTLLKIAPQLEHLRLANLKSIFDNPSYYYPDFNLNSVDEDSDCFTKLKTLKIEGNIEIDLTKILTKCSNTLKHLELDPLMDSHKLDLQHKLLSLNYLSIAFSYKDFEPFLKDLLHKCSGSLKTLKLFLNYYTAETDFCSLLEQTLKITTLDINSNWGDIEKFLNKCSLIQNLTLIGHKNEIDKLVLKDLRKLKLVSCEERCVTSVLKCASNSSLSTLHLSNSVPAECELPPVIPELDTVWIDDQFKKIPDLGQVTKLFPKNSKVFTEKMVYRDRYDNSRNKTVLRRVYNIA